MYLFQKNHGAISVFLILILVPCMLISSIFVDISRVHFSKAVAESSAELALSTLMANYDFDLSEYYGLMGSCQNINEYYDMVAGFYEQALHSKDIDNDEIQLLYQRVTNDIGGRFQSETISDILLIQNETEGVPVSAIDGANMHNSTVLQRQVVEFMKYRGPIVIVQQLIDLLISESDKGRVDGAEEADANKPMTEAQTKYYEAESELLKEANKSYWALRLYSDAITDASFTASTFQTYKDNIAGYRNAYEEINQQMIKNLYNTEGLQEYKRPMVGRDTYSYAKEDSSISYEVRPTPVPTPTPDPSASPTPSPTPVPSGVPTPEPTPTPTPEYHVTAAKASEITTALQNAINTFDEKKNAVVNAGSDLMSKLPGEGAGESYKIQWWVQMNAKINASGSNLSNEVKNAGDTMMNACAKAKAMVQCIPDSGTWDNANTLIANAESRQSTYLSGTNTNDAYINIVRQLESVSANNINQIKYQNLSVSVNGTKRTIPDAITLISNDLKQVKDEMDKFAGYLSDVIDGNETKDIPSLARIKELVTQYNGKLDTWESKAKGAKTPDGQNTELSIEHQDMIEKIRGGDENANVGEGKNDYKSEGIVKEITISQVEEMEVRLKNARSQFQAMSDAISAMLYGSSKVMDISDYPSFKAAASGQIDANSIPLANNTLNDYAAGRFSALFVPATGEWVTLHNLSDLEYSPVIHYSDDNDRVPPLYRTYDKVFEGKKPEDVEKQEDELNSKKDAGAAEAGNIKDKSRYPGPSGKDLPEYTSGTYEFGSSVLGSVMKLVTSLVDWDITGIRDDIYVTEYIMNMFSHAAFENENYYDLVEKDDKLGDLKLADKAYEKVYANYKGSSTQDGTWLSENPEDSYNKTLTNEMINESNNYAYQGEIEYILFGGSNEHNVKETYKTIYEIRYVLNLASAFLNFWNPTTPTGQAVNGVATVISSATAFIIPAPLVKAILLPILTIFETGKDLDRLQAGFPVELYKGKDDWWISLELGDEPSLSQFYDALANGNEKIESAHGLRYSDYLTFFVYLGLQDKYSGSNDGMLQRMANVIEKNMQLRTGKDDYSLENTEVYFQFKSKLRVRPLMLTLPYYSDYVEDPNMKDDWCTFEVDTIRGY